MVELKPETQAKAPTNIPTDYQAGYEEARLVDKGTADNYIAHTLIGDPLGDAMAEDLAELESKESELLIQKIMNQEEGAMRDAPASLRRFFEDAETLPEWLNFADFRPGVRMFHRNSRVILAAFVAGVLIEGFTTNIAKSFFITGRVRDQGIRRLGQNNRHMTEIFLPGGLYREGDGWKLSVRIRIVHARMRYLLEPDGRVGDRSLGRAHQRGASGLRHFRLFSAAAEAHENLGSRIHR